MAVVGALIGLLMPVLSGARERVNQVTCSNNMRQLGIGMQMYAVDNADVPPPSVFAPETRGFAHAPEQTVYLRVNMENDDFVGGPHSAADVHPVNRSDHWDGLGILFGADYISEPSLFYCPSHRDEHSLERYRQRFEGAPGQIVGNFQYRLLHHAQRLSDLPPSTTLISDATRSLGEYNHIDGNNMLKAGISVSWYDDTDGFLRDVLAGRTEDRSPSDRVERAWRVMDTGERPTRTLDSGRNEGPTHNRGNHQAENVDDG